MAEGQSHYWAHVMATVEDAERVLAAEMAEGMPTRYGDAYVFEGEAFQMSGGLPVTTVAGVRCGRCKGRHSGVKAVKFCHVRWAEIDADA
jgi:hypothetical protein